MLLSAHRQALQDMLQESVSGNVSASDSIASERLFDEMGLDSLDITEFLLRVETRYNFNLGREDRVGLTSLAAVESYLEAKGLLQ